MKKALSVFLAVLMMMSCAALSLQAFAADEIGVKTIDIDFTCDPKEGQKVGSDYTISLTGTDRNGNSDITFNTTEMYAEDQDLLCQGGTYDSGHGEAYVSGTYVVITKDDGAIVYPGMDYAIMYAPRRTKVTEDSDPNAARGSGAVYELGSKYNYYLVTKIASPHTFRGYTFSVRLNGEYAANSDTKYHDYKTLVQYLGSRYIGKDLNTINITFSCNPENGAPVGSDYEIDVDVEAERIAGKTLSVEAGEPLINRPQSYMIDSDEEMVPVLLSSLVAIYESDTLLYPGYYENHIGYAPARIHAEAHGSDPTGELGIGGANTPAFYETGKTYQYYATIYIRGGEWYQITDNTEIFVNGIKVTNYTKSGKALQIPVATVTCGHTHTMTFHEAVAATAYKEGNVAYYHCETCGKNYADEAGTQEIDNVVIAKLPRPIKTPSFIERLKNFFEKIKRFFQSIFRVSNNN